MNGEDTYRATMASHGAMLKNVIQLHREFKRSENLLELPCQK